MPDDHDDPVGAQTAGGPDHTTQQRSAGHFVQHLGQVGVHAPPFAGRKDDDAESSVP